MNAEQSVLGSMIKENYLIKDSQVKPGHLLDQRHMHLLKVMNKLISKNKSVDIITLSTLSDLANFGGVSYINELLSYANITKFQEYESLILENWKQREKRHVLNQAVSNDWEIGEIVSKLDDLNQAKMDDHTSIKESLVKVFESPWEPKKANRGITTGLKAMDNFTFGFQPSELTIIAARPSMGKSDVMLHFAKQAGWTNHLPIIYSLEMPESSLTSRMIASTGGFNRQKMRDPHKLLTDEQKKKWPDALGRLSDTNIQIFDNAGQSVSEIRAKTRKMVHQLPDKRPFILIDYLTLIRPENFYNGNAHLQVTEISKNLKSMAKEFDCPVVCLAQLSRAVEQRKDKKPMMSDIRESGSIEQDADLIIFLYREKYYDKTAEDDTLELIIAKNRNGPVGTVKVKYNEFTGGIMDEG